MTVPRNFRFSPSQALLFTPLVILGLAGILVLRNSVSHPLAHAEDSPDRSMEALIRLDYSPAYPFSGGVEASLEVRRLPRHETFLQKPLGSYRWAHEALEELKVIEWPGEQRLVLRSADGLRSLSIRLDKVEFPVR